MQAMDASVLPKKVTGGIAAFFLFIKKMPGTET